MTTPNITLATVTYGDRLHYVTTLVDSVLGHDIVKRVIIINNGSPASFSDLISRWNERISVVNLPKNMGSATGYKQAISHAIEDDSDYIWLMDDDNLPQVNTANVLLNRLKTLSGQYRNNNIAVVGFRLDHFSQVSINKPLKFISPPRSSFMGFSLLRLMAKTLCKFSFRKENIVSLPQAIEIPYAPYGGFLAHKNLYRSLGLPNERLVLYADDTEYTNRINKLNGKIFLIPEALIDDIEQSWHIQKKARNMFETFLLGTSDLRVFYAVRNQIWFEYNYWKKSKILYLLNKVAFIVILYVFSLMLKKTVRFKTIIAAINDGEKDILGEHKHFNLK